MKNQKVAWLKKGMVGRALSGYVIERGAEKSIVRVTSWESKRDKGELGMTWSVPNESLQVLA